MSVNSKMTALADEIRALSGTTTIKSIDAMTSDIDAANTEINQQAQLIAQISSALENKATAGGESGGGENSTSGVFDILNLPVGSVIGNNCKLYFPYAATNINETFYNTEVAQYFDPLIEFSDGTRICGEPRGAGYGSQLHLWWDEMDMTLWFETWDYVAQASTSEMNSPIILTEGATVVANYAADYNLVKPGRFMISNATVFSDKSADNSQLVAFSEGKERVHLTALDLQGCTKIGASVFQNKKITSVEFPNTVTSIEDNAFEMAELTLAIIPESVTSIGSKAFNETYSNPIVIMLGTTPPSISADTFGDVVEDMCYASKIYVPTGYGNAYKTAINWSLYANYIEEV